MFKPGFKNISKLDSSEKSIGSAILTAEHWHKIENDFFV